MLFLFCSGCGSNSQSTEPIVSTAIDTPSNIPIIKEKTQEKVQPATPDYIGVFVNNKTCIRIDPDNTFVRYFGESDFSNVNLSLDDPNKPIPKIWKPANGGKWRLSNDVIEFYDIFYIKEDGTRLIEGDNTEGDLSDDSKKEKVVIFEESDNKLRLDGTSFCFNSFIKGGTICFTKESNNWSEFLGPLDKEK